MAIHTATPVQHSIITQKNAPRAVIVGAGIIGLLTAFELLERGYQVIVLDQQAAGQGASWAGGGILSPLYPWKYPAAVNALARFGQAGYRRLNQRLYPITGIDCEIENSGLLILDPDQQQLALQYAEQTRDAEQIAEVVQGERLRQINPHLATDIQQAVWFPQIAHVRNPRVLKSLLAYLNAHPMAQIVPHVQIKHIIEYNHHVTAIVSEHNRQFVAEQFILATGAWSGLVAQHFAFELAIKPIHGQMVVFKTPTQWLPTLCMNNTMYAIPRRDGHVVCGSSTQDVGFSSEIFADVQNDIIKAAGDMLPRLLDFPMVAAWSGLRPGSPQGVPIIDRLPRLDNLWINAGHYRNGLVMAPASVQLLMQLMHGETPWVDIQPYQFRSRQFDPCLI